MTDPVNTSMKTMIIVGAGAALGLLFNALAPGGIPLRSMILPTDTPPPPGIAVSDDYLSTEQVRAVSELLTSGIDPDEFEVRFVIMDVREPYEFEGGHIPGAINQPLTQFKSGRPKRLDSIPDDAIIFVYCSDPECGSSLIVAEQLRLYGYKAENVRVFVGGLPAWEQAGLNLAYGIDPELDYDDGIEAFNDDSMDDSAMPGGDTLIEGEEQ